MHQIDVYRKTITTSFKYWLGMVTKERKGTLNSLSFPKTITIFPSYSFPFFFFVEKYRTKALFVKFDKEQAFLFIPVI